MFEEFLIGLVRADVRYVVVGGVAVVIHGYARLTADLDLVLDLETDNVRRAIDLMRARGLRPVLPVDPYAFADEATRRDWVENRNVTVFSMRDEKNPLFTVDLFAREPVPFEELWTRAERVALGNERIAVASIADLIEMKRAAGRPQDMIDIGKLEAIARKRND